MSLILNLKYFIMICVDNLDEDYVAILNYFYDTKMGN
jgi:hypothetical protein